MKVDIMTVHKKKLSSLLNDSKSEQTEGQGKIPSIGSTSDASISSKPEGSHCEPSVPPIPQQQVSEKNSSSSEDIIKQNNEASYTMKK